MTVVTLRLEEAASESWSVEETRETHESFASLPNPSTRDTNRSKQPPSSSPRHQVTLIPPTIFLRCAAIEVTFVMEIFTKKDVLCAIAESAEPFVRGHGGWRGRDFYYAALVSRSWSDPFLARLWNEFANSTICAT